MQLGTAVSMFVKTRDDNEEISRASVVYMLYIEFFRMLHIYQLSSKLVDVLK